MRRCVGPLLWAAVGIVGTLFLVLTVRLVRPSTEASVIEVPEGAIAIGFDDATPIVLGPGRHHATVPFTIFRPGETRQVKTRTKIRPRNDRERTLTVPLELKYTLPRLEDVEPRWLFVLFEEGVPRAVGDALEDLAFHTRVAVTRADVERAVAQSVRDRFKLGECVVSFGKLTSDNGAYDGPREVFKALATE